MRKRTSRSEKFWWRLRALLGVTARADVLVVLSTNPAPALSMAELASLTRFTKRNVALAVESLELAGAVTVDRVGNRQRVALSGGAAIRRWLGVAPPFIDWASRFTVLIAIARFSPGPEVDPVVRSANARSLVEGLDAAIRQGRLPRPQTDVIGPAFGPAFDRWGSRLADSIGSARQRDALAIPASETQLTAAAVRELIDADRHVR